MNENGLIRYLKDMEKCQIKLHKEYKELSEKYNELSEKVNKLILLMDGE